MYENEYRESQREKDAIAKSARLEQGANGLRKDMIPTRKEYNEKCGEVVTYNYNQPLKWKEFKQWDNLHRKEYLEYVIKRFHVGSHLLANEMFRVSQASVIREMNTLGVSVNGSRHKTEEERRAWAEFVKGKPVEVKRHAEEKPAEAQEEKVEKEVHPFTITINSGTISGNGSPSDFMPQMITYLTGVLPENCKVEITWIKEENNA